MAREMGKPVSQGRFEFDRALEEWDYSLVHAEEFLQAEIVQDVAVTFAPLGVVAVIAPWNFPLLLPLRGIIPALLAGNSVICKTSELSPRIGLLLEQVFAGCAPLFVATGGKELGAQVASLPVRVVAFTGSTAVGKIIAQHCGASLKRVLLELGGLDAAIVFPDADISRAARDIVRANARNTGQVCNAVKRALVHRDVYERFSREAIAASQELVYGDPLDERTEVGPLVSKSQYNRVQSYLDDACTKGAVAHTVSIEPHGLMFPQTILTQVPPDAKLLQEEPFGPLLPILTFETEQDAIQIANGTAYGLTASVWTSDAAVFARVSSQLEVGIVRQNSHAAFSSGIPWGGAKESGIGRMKTREGMREFTNVKVVGA
jgi:acyl-CoA reductase-like NAD-dependent aldehyde dehydrogenase